MISHILLTHPAQEPVALEEFKTHARISHTEDDALLTALMRAARQWCEHYTRRAFINQSWDFAINHVPEGRFLTLPRAPLSSVFQVLLYDEEDMVYTWEQDNYFADIMSQPGRLVLKRGASWPVLQRCANGLVVSYVAGYGESGSDVPEPLRLAIMQLALHWYDYRGESVQHTLAGKAPLTIEALLDPYRVLSVRGGCV